MTILNIEQMIKMPHLGYTFISWLILVTIIATIIYRYYFKNESDSVLVLYSISAILLTLLLTLITTPKEEVNYYKVLLHEDISIIEILEDYDFIEQNGLIITLTDKEKE